MTGSRHCLTALLLCAICASGRAASFQPALAPVNGSVYRMRLGDGTVRYLMRDAEEPDFLVGESPWVGQIDGDTGMVRTDPDAKVEHEEGYLFRRGRLVMTMRDGVERKAPEASSPTDSLDSLWIADERLVEAGRPHDIWAGPGRLRLWFTNPNDAGAFLAEIALFALAVAFLKICPAFRIFSGIVSALALCGLALTESRGAFVAFAGGVGVLLLPHAKRLLNWKIALGAAGVFALLATALLLSPVGDRFTRGIVRVDGDESNAIRVRMLEAAPPMFASAPGGWGFGNSGRAYIDWFQEKNDCLAENMISSHLTVAVEGGWALSALYIFAWLFVLLAFFAGSFKGGNTLIAPMTALLGISGLFNPSLFNFSIWILPLCALATGIFWRSALKRRSLIAFAGVSVIISVAFTVSAVAFGKRMSPYPAIEKSGDIVHIGKEISKTLLVDDGFAMNGGFWWLEGREIRDYVAKKPATGLLYNRKLGKIPPQAVRLILVGRSIEDFIRQFKEKPEKFSNISEAVFISPSISPLDIPEEIVSRFKCKAIMGDLAARLVRNGRALPGWVTLVPGAELYIPGWLDFAIGRLH